MDRVGLSNLALSKMGSSARIIDPSQGIKAARTIATHYDQVRRRVLRDGRWNFGKRRAALTASATAPVYGFDKQFPLPADFVRFVELKDSFVPDISVAQYQLEGRAILTNDAGPIYIGYIRDVEDLGEWDDLALEAFAELLGHEIADEMEADLNRKTGCWQRWLKGVAQARAIDAVENPPEAEDEDDWITARMLP